MTTPRTSPSVVPARLRTRFIRLIELLNWFVTFAVGQAIISARSGYRTARQKRDRSGLARELSSSHVLSDASMKESANRTTNDIIRVFISSTFRDMQRERDVMMERVFPGVRRWCEQRGVIWREIDLRWGITLEEAHRGETLRLCLEEVQACYPFFIGLLGE